MQGILAIEKMDLTLGKAVKKAEEWCAQGKRWHFHMLAIGCKFNATEKHTLVIENTQDKEEASAYTAEKPIKEGEKLVKLLHGKEIIGKQSAMKKLTNPVMQKIIERTRQLTAEKTAWHHHMLFPECKFNSRPGKWLILLEDPKTGKLIEAAYDEEPTEDLKQLETAYYSQKK